MRKPGHCPYCGHKEKQIIDSNYPNFDHFTDTVEKHFICEQCLLEWYETFTLEYHGCEVLVPTPAGYKSERYNKDGNKEI